MRSVTVLLLLMGCGSAAPAARGPAEPTKPNVYGPKDMSGGLGCVEPCELTKSEPPPRTPPPPKAPPVWERIVVPSGPVAGFGVYSVDLVDNVAYCGGKQLVTSRNKQRLDPADQALADVFALEYPASLDFTPDSDAARASSLALKTWIERYQATYVVAQQQYETQLASTDALVQVAAAARLYQLAHRFATVLAYAEIPRGLTADEAKQVFCDMIGDQASQLLARADEAKTLCTEKAAQVTVRRPLWWAPLCTQ